LTAAAVAWSSRIDSILNDLAYQADGRGCNGYRLQWRAALAVQQFYYSMV